MKISDAFPSKYLKADDVGQHRIPLTVKMVVIEDIADKEYKPVMHFMGKDKGMVLNKTNAGLCATVWGDETDHWQGKSMELFAQPVMFQGRQVMGLAVMPMLAAGQSMAPPQNPVQAVQAEAVAQNEFPTGPHDFDASQQPTPAHDMAQRHTGAVPASHPIPDSVVRDGSAGVAPQQQAVADAVDKGQAKHAVDPAGDLSDLPF